MERIAVRNTEEHEQRLEQQFSQLAQNQCVYPQFAQNQCAYPLFVQLPEEYQPSAPPIQSPSPPSFQSSPPPSPPFIPPTPPPNYSIDTPTIDSRH